MWGRNATKDYDILKSERGNVYVCGGEEIQLLISRECLQIHM